MCTVRTTAPQWYAAIRAKKSCTSGARTMQRERERERKRENEKRRGCERMARERAVKREKRKGEGEREKERISAACSLLALTALPSSGAPIILSTS